MKATIGTLMVLGENGLSLREVLAMLDDGSRRLRVFILLFATLYTVCEVWGNWIGSKIWISGAKG